MPHPETSNLNLRRRLLPGLLALAAAPGLRLLLLPLRKRAAPEPPLLVFSSYMIGDLFMALPALKRLAAAADIRVICRPDCAEILRREGFDPVPFDNAFRAGPGIASFWATLRAAWKLRSLRIGAALDLDADPRTAFWIRIAGAGRVISYRRSFGVLFDETFPLPPDAIHQADRDMAVVEGFLQRLTPPPVSNRDVNPPFPSPSVGDGEGRGSGGGVRSWLLSVWTRKPAKNWPLERWEEFMGRLRNEGIPFAVLHAPDGNAAYRAFRERLRGRVEFVEGSLESIADRVRESAGVIATDNFLGHMAGYYGRPVLWINLASPAAQVMPRGPRTVPVGTRGRPGVLSAEAVWRAFAELRTPTVRGPGGP